MGAHQLHFSLFIFCLSSDWFMGAFKSSLTGKISILYSYSYFSKNLFCHPINWLFVKIQLKGMMDKALIGIKTQAESNKDFYYST